MTAAAVETNAFVDPASLAQVWQCLKRGPKHGNLWSWRSAAEVTTLLLFCPHVRVFPNLSANALPGGVEGRMMASLERCGVISRPPLGPGVREQAVERTASLAGQHPYVDYLRSHLLAALSDAETQEWLDWSRRRALLAHLIHGRGLFDERFIPALASILDVSEGDMRVLWPFTCDDNYVRTLQRTKRLTCQDSLVLDAFLMSAVLRGFVNDMCAQDRFQILHHPLRQNALPLAEDRCAQVQLLATQHALVCVLLGTCLYHPTSGQRHVAWASSICALRSYLQQHPERLGTEDTDQAWSVAAKIAGDARLDACPRWVKSGSELSMRVLSALAALQVTRLYPCLGNAMLAVSLVTDQTRATNAVERRYLDPGRLEQLGRVTAGRIESVSGEPVP